MTAIGNSAFVPGILHARAFRLDLIRLAPDAPRGTARSAQDHALAEDARKARVSGLPDSTAANPNEHAGGRAGGIPGPRA